KTAKVIQFDHDQLSVFGVGQELSEGEWRGAVRPGTVRRISTPA
ncbi:RQC domain-containing protein, partial [Streptomyces albidoflavus]